MIVGFKSPLILRSADFLSAALVDVRLALLHVAFWACKRSEAERRVQPVSIPCDQIPTAQALQLRMARVELKCTALVPLISMTSQRP